MTTIQSTLYPIKRTMEPLFIQKIILAFLNELMYHNVYMQLHRRFTVENFLFRKSTVGTTHKKKKTFFVRKTRFFKSKIFL